MWFDLLFHSNAVVNISGADAAITANGSVVCLVFSLSMSCSVCRAQFVFTFFLLETFLRSYR